ncbi:MAG: NAD(P)H-binding protein, partial [Chloroflexota bacterium]|nr:NAD(P)H-binding protein [Chloroflexota bacterium]
PDQVDVLRRSIGTLIDAMEAHDVRRLVNLSGAGVEVPGDRKPAFDRLMSRLVRLFARHVVAAKQAEFDELARSGLDWVAVRPPLVRDGPRTGEYRSGLDVLHPGARISRADVADFMLSQATAPTFVRQAPFVCYAR